MTAVLRNKTHKAQRVQGVSLHPGLNFAFRATRRKESKQVQHGYRSKCAVFVKGCSRLTREESQSQESLSRVRQGLLAAPNQRGRASGAPRIHSIRFSMQINGPLLFLKKHFLNGKQLCKTVTLPSLPFQKIVTANTDRAFPMRFSKLGNGYSSHEDPKVAFL